jgi:hypothetical protein
MWIALFLLWGSLLQAQRNPGADYEAIPSLDVPKKIKVIHVGNDVFSKEWVSSCFYGTSEKQVANACEAIGDAYKVAGDIQTARMYWKHGCSEHLAQPCLELARSFRDVETKRYILENDSGCFENAYCEAELATSYEEEPPIDKTSAAYHYTMACSHSGLLKRPVGCFRSCELKADFGERSKCFLTMCIDRGGDACSEACNGAPDNESYLRCLDSVGDVLQGRNQMLKEERDEWRRQHQNP